MGTGGGRGPSDVEPGESLGRRSKYGRHSEGASDGGAGRRPRRAQSPGAGGDGAQQRLAGVIAGLAAEHGRAVVETTASEHWAAAAAGLPRRLRLRPADRTAADLARPQPRSGVESRRPARPPALAQHVLALGPERIPGQGLPAVVK